MPAAGRAQEISITSSFSNLGLSAELLRAVAEQGYTEPTPIQVQAIPLVLERRDLMAGAQTGTGKTAGFALPILQLLGATPRINSPRTLILAPTRELAAQVEESIRAYGKYVGVRTAAVFGGVSIAPQVKALRSGVDVLVATPGRLLDHLQQRTVDLSRVEILVLDEADRMLDLGFIRDIRRILNLLPAKRQNLLFSATFSDEIQDRAASFMHAPAIIQAAVRNAPSDLVAQVVHPVDAGRKRELLAHLITTGNWQQVLVFTRTKHGANRLAQQLVRDGIEADAIHGNKSQSRRTRSLADFKRGEMRVLVATDIAARGLDIEELPHVVNFDLPHVPEDYVHRIGRTGRAGSTGEAVSLVSQEDQNLMAGIERLLKRQVERKVIPGFELGRPGSRPPEPDDRPARSGRRGPGGQRGNATDAGRGNSASGRNNPNQDGRAGSGHERRVRDDAAERWARDPASRMTMHQPGVRNNQQPGTRNQSAGRNQQPAGARGNQQPGGRAQQPRTQAGSRGRARTTPALLGGPSRNGR
jgi:ATP-dependent RNA helicase RhlE